MSRLVPAAEQLITQVREARPSMKKVKLGEPDGFDRIRDVTFDASTSRWLTPILEAVADPRIKSVTTTGRGQATVHFVPDYRADFKSPYPLDTIDEILNDDQ